MISTFCGATRLAARRLAIWCVRVNVVLFDPAAAMTSVPALHLSTLWRMGLSPTDPPSVPADLILDGLVEHSLRGAPRAGRSA